MPRNIMSIGRIMYSKMPTKPKLSHFFGFGLPSIMTLTHFTVRLFLVAYGKNVTNIIYRANEEKIGVSE